MSAVMIKGIAIGEGVPKICAPLVGATHAELIEEANLIKSIAPDIAELRIDCFEGIDEPAEVAAAIRTVTGIIPNIPLLFTFRTTREGGKKELSTERYAALNKTACDTGLIDLLDVELFTEERIRDGLIAYAHGQGIRVVVSNHDFQKTPAVSEIVSRLIAAADIGGDIPKIAVMPQSAEDLLTLLSATVEAKRKIADRPIITMSMAGQGVLSRFGGEVFGSAITFGSAKTASAPGQVPVSRLRTVLAMIHESI